METREDRQGRAVAYSYQGACVPEEGRTEGRGGEGPLCRHSAGGGSSNPHRLVPSLVRLVGAGPGVEEVPACLQNSEEAYSTVPPGQGGVG